MLTLEDIENISFRESRFGMRSYVCEDVDRFVDDVTEKIKDLEEKNRALQEKIGVLEQKLQSHEEKADSVQDAIITAEMTAKSLVRNATTKVEKMMTEAVEKSDKIIEKADKEADDKLYRSTEKARMILDNALATSADCVAENNRMIEDQKIYITMLQDEATKFRETLMEMYQNHLALIEKLPERQKCEEYQKDMKENYPTEEPVTADAVVEKLKEQAENAEIPKRDERQITVEMPGQKKEEEPAEEEIVFNSSGVSQNIKINFINENDAAQQE